MAEITSRRLSVLTMQLLELEELMNQVDSYLVVHMVVQATEILVHQEPLSDTQL